MDTQRFLRLVYGGARQLVTCSGPNLLMLLRHFSLLKYSTDGPTILQIQQNPIPSEELVLITAALASLIQLVTVSTSINRGNNVPSDALLVGEVLGYPASPVQSRLFMRLR